ncbi:hypothetical protein P700755_002179 [Psychroflexus torquis ATCC 700755]|uniref:Uncharacterized protein n=1 Tax=Psychroflexus torquis (strain ATCC 700755 / CIP 106069 / ACAM 623) TaxID=313595 RepID=K4IF10_PSYTT|nr:hypothetical protein P700755_002179 [Psychroflexus torquis ATCC 700755]
MSPLLHSVFGSQVKFACYLYDLAHELGREGYSQVLTLEGR